MTVGIIFGKGMKSGIFKWDGGVFCLIFNIGKDVLFSASINDILTDFCSRVLFFCCYGKFVLNSLVIAVRM